MKEENGLGLVSLAIIIIILIVFAGVAFKLILGHDGVLEKVTTEEVEYNKTEVLEELNFMITEKYLEAYKKATAAGKNNNIDQYYNTEKVIKFLKGYNGGESGEDYSVQDSKVIIEDLAGNTDMYFIKISELKTNISGYGNGENEEGSNDFFFIKKESEQVYKVYYKNSNGEDEEIGQLEFEPEI